MNSERNIVLIGMPGCGKTTFGKAVAKELQRSFYDADDVVVTKEKKTIPELFAISEACFRDAETRAAQTLAAKKGCIIACGGGVVKRPVNIEIYKKTGVIIWIDRSPATIIGDVDADSRPLLREGAQKIYDLYHERLSLYQKAADYTIVNDKASEDVIRELIDCIKTI